MHPSIKEEFDKIEATLKEEIDRLSSGRLVLPDFLGARAPILADLAQKRSMLDTIQFLKNKSEDKVS